MAGGSKKKKTKHVANPARGFATTSLQSKAKTAVETSEHVNSSDASVIATPDTVSAPNAPMSANDSKRKAGVTRELHELNPEELEAQLEASELQQFVEQNAAKVRKESSRHASRLETDKRLLRGQADYLSVKDWLPEELMQQILEFTLAEYDSEQSGSRAPVGDDLLAKVWTLRCCLLDLGIPLDRVNDVLGWLVSHPPPQDGNSLWGLADALDWLSLHCTSADLSDYDYQRPKAVPLEVGFRDDLPSQELQPKAAPQARGLPADVPSTLDQDPVSDLEDDLEPDELLSIYLRTKARLFEIEPDSADVKRVKRGRNAASQGPRTAIGKQLQQKLQKIESDMLFDLPQAEAQWAEKRIVLTREAAERRRLQLSDSNSEKSRNDVKSDTPPNGVLDEAEKLGQELLKESEDDGEMLGGMFDALPGVQESNATSNGHSPTDVIVRDFGRMTGMNPKRVLEEACKARDSGVKLSYKLVSPTTYASRHSMTISWSKDQDLLETSYLTSVDIKSKPRGTVFTALKEATPDSAQSEAYIATVALFVVFSGSPKEEKAHMRLPPTFRNLWDELSLIKEEHTGAADRDTVKQIRQLIEQNAKQDTSDDEDEVVFRAGSRHRSTVASGVATPSEPVSTKEDFSQELQDLWLRKVSTPHYQKMMLARMNLPIFHYKSAILEAIERSQVVVLVSETGSGKSTQLPAYILEHELSHGRKCKVYCTEPRRISAISLAQRVSEELGEHKNAVGTMHSLVGYAIRLESQTSASTRLVYATTGIVLRMLENANGLGDITHLVIDEVHERSIDTDFLLIILRSLLQRRPDLKVILMSATVNAQKFSSYLDGAPIIDVPGRTFPVQAAFLEDAIELTGHTNEDASQAAVDDDADGAEQDEDAKAKGGQLTGYSKRTLNTLANYDEYRIDYSLIVKLIQRVAFHADYQRYSSATLVFLPGIGEIKRLHEILTSQPAFQKGWKVHALHSSFSNEDQQAAFEVPPKGIRKVVLATNIAETGITIPDVTCVIDTGKHKEMRFDEKRQMSRLILSFIAKANAKQRRGRAGRVQQGLCFHLFTKYRHDELMAENQTPEMLRLSLQDLVMRVKICKLGGIENALSQALDPPSTRNIRRAVDALIEVDALTPHEELTPLGQQLAKIPLDAQLGKLILLGSHFGCLDATLTVAATLTSKTPFLNPMHAKKQADTVRLGYKRADSDLFTVYNAYCTWRKVCTTPGMSEYQFCDKNFLSAQNLANIEDLKGQLLTSLVDAGFVSLGPDEKAALARVRPGSRQRNFIVLPENFCRTDNDDAVVQSVVTWSFYPKIVKQEGKGWRNIANNQTLALHPTSVNKMSLSPDVRLLSFYSIMQSNSRFTNAQETTATPEMALVLLAGDSAFHMYAGVIIIDGNRLRYKVKDWKTMIALKMLRTKLKEVLARLYRLPGKELTGKHAMWMELLMKMFEKQRRA
ncbi:P-loop containing nucleoside triphosphate hydrolase protein [Teratosphaeria nubilosa]|uniref:RNA helicase n=1 Tax=Teratosphaeria nubilosa TaxID=161662 RepID=A0A6G1KU57_9PEZI|nr:P-loop containing nucleoside triphosphate hydrolase protein [Teratosphaeria nubilosa]